MEIFLVCHANIVRFHTQNVAPKYCEASVSLLFIGPLQEETISYNDVSHLRQ